MGRASKRQARAKQELADLTAGLGGAQSPTATRPAATDEEAEVQSEAENDPAPDARGGGAFAALEIGHGDDAVDGSEGEGEEAIPEAASKAKRKPKKKKPKKNKATPTAGEAAPEAGGDTFEAPAGAAVVAPAPAKAKKDAPSAGTDGLDEIDRALKELGVENTSSGALGLTAHSSKRSALRNLLAIDVKLLDADAELRRMFGSKVIAAAPRSSPARTGYHARLSNNPHHAVNQHLSKSSLAKPQGSWPPYGAAGGASLAMRSLKPEQHVSHETALPTDQWFTFEHPPAFRAVQAEFMQAVGTMDPNELVALMQIAPYHPDTLLQLSDVSAHQGDPGQSADFLDRALYAYERGFGGLFSSGLGKGDARLDFSRVENRGFFRALEKKVASLAKRGCWRAACEFGKLLLALDPYQDPYGALLLLDFLAPKAKEYKWLIDLLKELPEVQDPEDGLYVEAYPGLAYAKALSLWHLEEDSQTDHEESSQCLRTAILRFPMLLPPLSDKTGFPLPPAFLRIRRSIPQTSFSKDPAYILHLQSQLYVVRSADLWKEEGVSRWLTDTATWCGNILERKLPMVPKVVPPEHFQVAEEDLSWGEEIATGDGAYGVGVAPGGILRNIFVSDIASMKAFLPPSIQQSTSYSFDPLPPPDSTAFDKRYFSLAAPTRRSRTSRSSSALPNHQGLVEALHQPGGLQALLERMQVALQADEQGVEMSPEERREMIEQLEALLQAQRQMDAGGVPGAMPAEGGEEEHEDEDGEEEQAAQGGLMERFGAWFGGGRA